MTDSTAETASPRYIANITPTSAADRGPDCNVEVRNLTNSEPMIEANIETPAISNGKNSTPATFPKNMLPRSITAITEITYVSNKSAAMPAVSPTLSPTLSAIVAGLRGSSSGMPASTLPTRSAPTSAPFVNIPPPSRANTEISEPPNPRPIRDFTSPVIQ